jgi:hypothetical protein
LRFPLEIKRVGNQEGDFWDHPYLLHAHLRPQSLNHLLRGCKFATIIQTAEHAHHNTTMSELEFGKPLDGGEKLLREFVSGMMLFKGWEKMKKSVSSKLMEFMPEEHPEIRRLDMQTKLLMLLEVLGPEFRALWGDIAMENYKPELLREPYMEENKKEKILEVLNLIYVAYIEHLMSDEQEMNFEKNGFFVEAKTHFQTILEYKEERCSGDTRLIREDLGQALVAIMRNEDLFARLLSTPLTPESAYNKGQNDSAEAQHYGLGGSMKTQEDLDEKAVRDLVTRYHKETSQDVCLHLRGTLLGDYLREEMWAFRYLTRSASEPPNTKNATPSRDLRRLAKEKGIDLVRLQSLNDGAATAAMMARERDREWDRSNRRHSERGDSSSLTSQMTTLIRESVWAQIQTALSTSAGIAARKAHAERQRQESGVLVGDEESGSGEGEGKEAGKIGGVRVVSPSESPRRHAAASTNGGTGKKALFGGDADEASIRTLARRAELLVHAGYILNDDVNDRSVNIAIMLMRVFPAEPPTCEKILRVYQRILTECMPSEQLHKQYSLATVAHKAWELLLERDPALLHFLQNYEIDMDVEEGSDDEDGGGSRGRMTGRKLKNLKPQLSMASQTEGNLAEIPRSLLLLKGWLETGFIGKVPEHSALFIWDQLTLHGACPNDFKQLLPPLCCIVLQALREPIMTLPQNLDLVAAIHELGLDLRTRDLIESMRTEECLSAAPPSSVANYDITGGGSMSDLAL